MLRSAILFEEIHTNSSSAYRASIVYKNECRTELMEILVLGLDRDDDEYERDFSASFDDCVIIATTSTLTLTHILNIAMVFQVSPRMLHLDCIASRLIEPKNTKW